MHNIIEKYKGNMAEALCCFSIVSVFIPIKIYPLVFLLAALCFYIDTPRLLRHYWVFFLALFTAYAGWIFLTDLPANHTEIINFLKLPINFSFLYFAAGWVTQRDNTALIRRIDLTLHVVLALTLIQLLVYHEATGFQWIAGSSTSAKGSALYRPVLYFWGLIDKNMFGARIALLGFIYLLVPVIRQHRILWWRILLVFLLAWLSLSRTPVVALLIGVYGLLWLVFSVRWRIMLVVVALLATPFVAQKVIRIDTITASNDGMGVRVEYWKTFIEHFTEISPLGNGFMSGSAFLSQYARFYHGEPHIHNTFMSCYLDFGIIGLLSYGLFLYFFYRFCLKQQPGKSFWWIAFAPLLAIMMILYSGYDNDIILYLVLILLLGSSRAINFKQVEQRVIAI
ncbi:O-antigen ligase family protein [Parapedobacter lycopersici]|uniref:O-antigen ligase family protein n=1 Tax=Parapedobacter lycopersici TaxID=1864939 RepID=UPI00214D69D8|nr:O-antigen ligase family protein [Parapedobacter lycopersici]